MRARFYNPVVARFTQEDTYRGDGLNLYVYCTNRPIYYTDPSGHTPNCVKDAIENYLKEHPNASQIDALRAIQSLDSIAKFRDNIEAEIRYLNHELQQDEHGYRGADGRFVSTPVEFLKSTQQVSAVSGDTKVPNPYGQPGCPLHQAAADSAQPMHGGTIAPEYRFPTPDGQKTYRQADRVEIVDGKVATIYQAGRVDAQGFPVTREAEAIVDIMGSPDYNGAPIYFIPYNSNSALIL